MNSCPLAYTDTCKECEYNNNCTPGKALEKLDLLQIQVAQMKQQLDEITRMLKKN